MTASRTSRNGSSGDDGGGHRHTSRGTHPAGQPPLAGESCLAMADIDFSRVNLQYLIGARDLARGNPERAALLLGATETLVRLLAELDPAALVAVADVKAPLLILRQEPWWWHRLFIALQSGRPDELRAVLDQAALIVANGAVRGVAA